MHRRTPGSSCSQVRYDPIMCYFALQVPKTRIKAPELMGGSVKSKLRLKKGGVDGRQESLASLPRSQREEISSPVGGTGARHSSFGNDRFDQEIQCNPLSCRSGTVLQRADLCQHRSVPTPCRGVRRPSPQKCNVCLDPCSGLSPRPPISEPKELHEHISAYLR